ncbi:hypothetical protein GZH82_01490 [Staphylococcus ursi]|nr:hypothetical protein GZH82_01490 [Staphylococcus sp. MI 10-1553]
MLVDTLDLTLSTLEVEVESLADAESTLDILNDCCVDVLVDNDSLCLSFIISLADVEADADALSTAC